LGVGGDCGVVLMLVVTINVDCGVVLMLVVIIDVDVKVDVIGMIVVLVTGCVSSMMARSTRK
jgi:hypothetical protein